MSDSDSSGSSSSSASKSSASSKSSKSASSSESSSHSEQEHIFARPKVNRESSSSEGEKGLARGKGGVEEESSGSESSEKPRVTSRVIAEESSSGRESGEKGKNSGRGIAEESSSASESSEDEKPKARGRAIAEDPSSDSSSEEEKKVGGARHIADESSSDDTSSSTNSSASTSTSGTSASSKSSKSSKSSGSKKSNASGLNSSESDTSSSSSSDTDSEKSQRAEQDTLQRDKKPVEVDDVKLVEKKDISDMKFEDPNANNFWVRLGRKLDSIYYAKYSVALAGLWSIALCVVFSILCNLSLSGYGIPYGISFIFLLILFLFWAAVFISFALSRFRYMLDLIPLPGTESLFDKKYFNKEGARVVAFFCVAIVFILFFIHLIMISVHLDKSSSPWSNWSPVFIPIWIAVGFVFIGFIFSARLMKSWVSVIVFIVVVGCIIAQTIVILLKINGHIHQKWYKALVPLWLMNFAVCLLVFWHAAARTVFQSAPHFINVCHKSKKERAPVTSCRDQATALPVSVAAVFLFLFQVCCVIKAEGVKYVRYNIPWSLIWIWFWIAMFFLAIWCLLYKLEPSNSHQKMKRVSNKA